MDTQQAILHGRVKEARWLETYIKGKYPWAARDLARDWDSLESDANLVREVVVNRQTIQGIARRTLGV